MEPNKPAAPPLNALLARAIRIAAAAHEHQLDKAGAPYIFHPIRMMMRAATPEEQIVAVLHDVIEDCPDWSMQRLRDEGFPDEILTALEGVTRRTEEDDDYEAFVRRAAANPISRAVKLLDLEDNMDMTRLGAVGEKELARLHKYHKAYVYLTQRGPSKP